MHKTRRIGIRGEEIIAAALRGDFTSYSADHDLVTAGVKIEIKTSKLYREARSKYSYWVWNKILGESGNKKFDFLVLLGEKNRNHQSLYKSDLNKNLEIVRERGLLQRWKDIEKYVIFCIPFRKLSEITEGYLKLSSKPNKRRICEQLFAQFEMSPAEFLIHEFRPSSVASPINAGRCGTGGVGPC